VVLLQAENITKSFGDLVLFENLSLSIHKDQKIAILARNGAGKTTLLNIISGTDTPDSGKITMRNGISLGYLSQTLNLDENKTIFEEIYDSSSEVINIIKEYEEALHSDDKKKLEVAISKMEAANAWDHEVKIHQMVAQLQLPESGLKISSLSGGQKKRVALANLLINEPDIIIMDEPTNHLDLDIIVWLEDFLIQSNSTLLMVTHDRYFLDRVCNEILELDDKTLY
jgi:ABC transport system ATP-binding/permease protein